ncbi:hypothetical protein [Vibrio alginolyticus]|uniref:hypothetical protein n=1 Tax=Vibrio alginolyticus TaxID=663 RepID=UPI000AA5677F|nr:hypothetical protein [Vibrio alginolyticus]
MMNLDTMRLINSPKIRINEVGFLTTEEIENSMLLPAKYAWPISMTSWFFVFLYAYNNGHLENLVFITIGYITASAASAIVSSTITTHLKPCDVHLCSQLEPIIDYDEKTFLALRKVKKQGREFTISEAKGIIEYVDNQKKSSYKKALYAKRASQP